MTHGLVVSDRRPRGVGRAFTGALVVALAVTTGVASAAPRGQVRAPIKGRTLPTINTLDNAHHADANQIDMFVTNHGSFAWDIATSNPGFIFPKGTTKTAVYAAGLWLGGKVNGQVRTTVAEYSQEYGPGPMKDGTFQTDTPDFRVYKVDRGQTSTEDYTSWQSGPARAQGAPLDSTGSPAVLGDQSLWTVYNDANPKYHTNDAGGTPPLGVQVEQTEFQYARQGALGNAVFMIWKIKNLGANTITDAFVSVWSDPDLGGANDDLVGCDTTLGLGFVYNETDDDALYGAACPAVGFDFLQGPIGDNGERLPMQSFNKYINGTDPHTTQETYNYMQGLNNDGTPLHEFDDTNQPVTRFNVSGDPVNHTGWEDVNGADRRLMLSAGPFTFAPGDSQTIVAAIIVGQGPDRLSSIALMKQYDTAVQQVFDLNFAIPAPPPSAVTTTRAFDKAVDIIWGTDPVGDVQTSEILNEEFHFEGYNVYQGSSAAGPWKKIATFDEDDAITTTYADVFSATAGGTERVITQSGTNSGLQNHMYITKDAIHGGNLINGKDYYFAVTSWSYDVRNLETFTSGENEAGTIVETLESAFRALHVIPGSSGAVLIQTANHTSGISDGNVSIEYVDQAAITGHTYSVTFRDDGAGGLVYDITDTNTGQVKVSGASDQTGSYTSPVFDGVMVRVSDATPAIRSVQETMSGSSTLSPPVDVYDTDSESPANNSTGEYYVKPNSDPTGSSAISRFTGSLWTGSTHDYEIRFTAAADNYCWDFFGQGDYSYVNTFQVPVQLWDVTENKQITFLLVDGGATGEFSWGDGLYFHDIDYNSVNWTSPGIDDSAYDPNFDYYSFRRVFFYSTDDTATVGYPAPGTVVKITTFHTNTAADVYTFTTDKPGTVAGTVIGRDLSKVRVVPNPYINRSAYELNQFDRVIKFTNLPASRKVTIRIFNLAGDLVRTITKDATMSSGGSDAATTSESIVQWDLNTTQNLPVASGIYLYHIEVEGVGETKGQMIIFTEKERLDTY